MTAKKRRPARLRPRQAAAVLLPPRFAVRAGFPAVTAVLGYLLVLAAAGGMFGMLQLLSWQRALTDRVVVELLPDDEGRVPPPEAVMARLRQVRGVARLEPVSEGEIRAIAAPWLGSAQAADIALPRLITVGLADPAARAGVAKALEAWPDQARLFTPMEAIKGLAVRVRLAIAVAAGAAVLLLGASALLVVFAVEAEFASHLDTLSLARALGADDRVILGAFAHRFAVLAGRGVLAALALFALTVGLSWYWGGAPVADMVALRAFAPPAAAALAAAAGLVGLARLAAWASARAALRRLA